MIFLNDLDAVESIETKFELTTNQGVVGSIPVSRTKNGSLQRKLQAFSFLCALFWRCMLWANAILAGV